MTKNNVRSKFVRAAAFAFAAIVPLNDVRADAPTSTPSAQVAVDASENVRPVENAAEKKAFQKSVRRQRLPWYSSEDETVVYLPLERQKTPKNGRFDASRPTVDDAFHWTRQFYWFLAFVGMLALLGLLIWAFYVAYRNRRPAKETDEKANRARRLETLAPEARTRLDNLDEAAAEAFESGDYRAAIVYYFSWFLVEADKRRLILMNKGKTNREYWFELDANLEAQTIYAQIATVFERVYFGDRPINRAEFESVWTLREPFEDVLRRKDAEEARRLAARQTAQTLRARTRRDGDFGPLGNGNGNVNANANGFGNGTTPKSTLIWAALGLAAAGAALSGCARNWNEKYVDHSCFPQSNDQSVDGVSVFADYCKTKTKRVDRNHYSVRVDGARYETIVWFYRGMYYGGVDLKPDFEKFDSNGPKIGESDASAKAREPDLRIDAVPAEIAEFESVRASIEKWLKAKPNRTFVFVPSGWRADVDFWTAFAKAAPSNESSWVEERLKAAREQRDERAEFDVDDWNQATDLLNERRQACRRAFEAAKNNPTIRAARALSRLVRRTATGKLGADVDRFWSRLEKRARAVPPELVARAAADRAAAQNDDGGIDAIFSDPNVDGGCGDPVCDVCYPWNSSAPNVDAEPRFDEFGNPFDADASQDAKKDADDAPWFRVDFLPTSKRLERFAGVDEWTNNLPATKEIWATRSLAPLGETEALLSVDDEPLVARRKVGDSRFYVLSSPTFLLNYSLLDPTNRVLAARLTDDFNRKGRALVFVGSNIEIQTDASPPDEEPISPFSLSQLTPFAFLVWSLIALAALVVCRLLPIFGRPRRIATEPTNDFGKHVDAIAFLLERSDCRRWARTEIETFRAAREAGDAFAKPNAEPNDDSASDSSTEKTTE